MGHILTQRKFSLLLWQLLFIPFYKQGKQFFKLTNSLHLGKCNTMLTNLNDRQTSKDSDIWFEWDKWAKDHPPIRSLSELLVLLLLFRKCDTCSLPIVHHICILVHKAVCNIRNKIKDLGYSLDPGETELAWTTWKLKLQTHFCEHRLGKSILTGYFNCWSFNIMLNEEYFKK